MTRKGEMTSVVAKAVSCFKEGCSCSLAILTAYGPMVGLDRVAAKKSNDLLVGRKGRVCRAVLAAMVVLGLKYRTPRATDDAGGRVREFSRRVESRKGSLSCQYPPGSSSKPDPTCIQHIAEILEGVL